MQKCATTVALVSESQRKKETAVRAGLVDLMHKMGDPNSAITTVRVRAYNPVPQVHGILHWI